MMTGASKTNLAFIRDANNEAADCVAAPKLPTLLPAQSARSSPPDPFASMTCDKGEGAPVNGAGYGGVGNGDRGSSSNCNIDDSMSNPKGGVEDDEPDNIRVLARLVDACSKAEVERRCLAGARAMQSQVADPQLIMRLRRATRDTERRVRFLDAEIDRMVAAAGRMGFGTVARRAVATAGGGSGVGGRNDGGFAATAAAVPAGAGGAVANGWTIGSRRGSLWSSAPGTRRASISVGSSAASAATTLAWGRRRSSTSSAASTGVALASGATVAAARQLVIPDLPEEEPAAAEAGGVVLGRMAGILGRVLGARPDSGNGSSVGTSADATAEVDEEREVLASTIFDYWRTDARLTSELVTHRLRAVQYKLWVERQLQAGTERLFQAVAAEARKDAEASRTAAGVAAGSERRREIAGTLAESDVKVKLLLQAQRRHMGVFVGDPEMLNADSQSGSPTRPFRRPLSGKLTVHFDCAPYLPSGTRPSGGSDGSSGGRVYAEVRVDGASRGRTRVAAVAGVGAPRWRETVEVELDRAQEVELVVRDDGSGNRLLGLVWFRVAELHEALRAYAAGPAETAVAGGVVLAEYRLDLEPGGELHVKLGLAVEENRLRRRNEGVVRRRPVQKVFPAQGHRFTATQFYQAMKCAVCSEFLLTGKGYQCQGDSMHKGEAQFRVRARGSGGSGGNNGSMLSWCCHCGSMLPLLMGSSSGGGSGSARRRHQSATTAAVRCSECGVSAHRECAHFVPDLCGLSPALIAQMKMAIDRAERLRADRETGRATVQAAQTKLLTPATAAEVAGSSTGALSLTARKGAAGKAESGKTGEAAVKAAVEQPAEEVAVAVTGRSAMSLPAVAAAGDAPATLAVAVAPEKRKSSKGVGLEDFELVSVLGKGNFGKVMLASERATKQLYAIKVLKKDFIVSNDDAESVRAEKRVFLVAGGRQAKGRQQQRRQLQRHPFLVQLHSCFQTESRVYFVMEYVAGGDLMWHVQREAFDEARARFYAAEVLLAVEYFHANDVVYRDLKLDNILLGPDGHIKLADYGLCKEGMCGASATTETFCGTPEFMAPEILLERPYTRAVDWWAFGVLVYELFLGEPPFAGDDEDKIFDRILHRDVVFPAGMPADAVDLVRKLLEKKPERRLGSGEAGAGEVKAHRFFGGIDFDALLELQVQPPFSPKI
ncbi:Serine/threonine kinase, partial [Cladochytrium tenue]